MTTHKVKLGELVYENGHDWFAEQIESDMENGIMTVRYIRSDKIYLRLINKLENQNIRISELESKIAKESK